jgi:hypothetical protein
MRGIEARRSERREAIGERDIPSCVPEARSPRAFNAPPIAWTMRRRQDIRREDGSRNAGSRSTEIACGQEKKFQTHQMSGTGEFQRLSLAGTMDLSHSADTGNSNALRPVSFTLCRIERDGFHLFR